MPEALVRLHLVAPSGQASEIAACFAAACEEGDVASIVAAPAIAPDLIEIARKHDVALLTTDARAALRLDCDGAETDSRESYDEARQILGYSRIVGARCGSSRHLAMELADAGADYVALSQSYCPPDAEPIVAWWSGLFEIPCIAADPVEPSGLAALLSQGPDFIRPAETMWRSPDESRAVIAATMRAIAERRS